MDDCYLPFCTACEPGRFRIELQVSSLFAEFFALYRLLELVVTRWTECMRYRRLFSACQT